MNAKENKQKITENLDELLNQADKLAPESRAEFLAERGVRIVGCAEWIRDDTYTGGSKELYNCSKCEHRKSIRMGKQYQLTYMHFCPFCGAYMTYKNGSKNSEL